jgi:hypothetical protein
MGFGSGRLPVAKFNQPERKRLSYFEPGIMIVAKLEHAVPG